MAIKHLKKGKNEGHSGHYTDHLIYAPDSLHIHLSLMFSAMFSHGCTPSGFLNTMLCPIPKNKRKSLADSENYRGIALSSVLAKVLDWIILTKYRQELDTSTVQFGFKAESSTTQCTFVVSECVNYYIKHGSNVHLVFLDATKAFDRVHYVKLFRLLIKRGLCPIVSRLLLNLYTRQNVRVKWEKTLSPVFSSTNGVKQGGVLSPILFSIYIDELLDRLRQSGYGCHIGNIFLGAVAYADDITPTDIGRRW